jgi:hypothetical protein
MTGVRKGADLKRDPRFALHGPTFHPEEARRAIGRARRRSPYEPSPPAR